MKVVILGSGLLGISTAYVLASRGHEVHVLDRQEGPGCETSFSNGGQLSYTHAEPWANPHVLKKLPKWMLDPKSPLIFRFRLDPAMWRWSIKFLMNCTSAAAKRNCVTMLRLGLYSREKMAQIRAETSISFDYTEKGILHIFSMEADLEHAAKWAEFQSQFGAVEKMLSRDEVLALEPNLIHTPRAIVGGMLATQDQNGDAHLFCERLSEVAATKHGAVFHYGVTIEALESDGQSITAVRTDKGEFKGDAFVMALGSYSPLLLKNVGINVPIYPMKGYSITFAANDYSPCMSITDGSAKIVYSRLGERVRIAGTAELAGYSKTVNEKRIEPIVDSAKGLFPKADWNAEITKWACLRPSTPSGAPILGRAKLSNLFLNTGHGTLGWTQAAGSAYALADVMENKTPEIPLHGLLYA